MVNIRIEFDGDPDNVCRWYGIFDGHLEAYMGAYGHPAGETLTYLIADYVDEKVFIPQAGDADAQSKIGNLLREWRDKLDWWFDKDELLAEITLAEDVAEDVRSTWESVAEMWRSDPAPPTAEELSEVRRRQAESLAFGYQRRQEELLADEMLSASPELSQVARDTTQGNVGLTVKYT